MNKNETKSSSALDLYCKTNFLDESSDFIECESKNNVKVGSQKSETLLCEICRKDITPLDVNDREVHVNKCIDKQSSSSSDVAATQNGNVFILGCPLCFRQFSAPELQSSHIKKCGKSKGLSTQSIIQALELQKKHAQERICLGLPVKPVKPPRVNANKKTTIEPKSKAQSDLQLAKALSLSLANKTQEGEPMKLHQRPGKKRENGITPLLVLRTEEERRKMLLERVAFIIAAPVNISEEDCSVTSEVDILSQQQKEIYNQICLLWSLSSKASEISDYYVPGLCDWIKPSDVEVGTKLSHLSQIAGHEILTQLPCNYTFSCTEERNESVESKTVSVVECLRSLVASSWMSDVDVHTSCGTVIPAHKLLLAARCPPLKQDSKFCSESGRAVLKWERISFDAALQFLNFIYTGNIEVKDDAVQDLRYLANKYEVLDLEAVLRANEPEHILSETEPTDRSMDESSQSITSQQGRSSAASSSTEESNMDLDIVCNFVDTSLKFSQQPDSEPVHLEPAALLKYSCQNVETLSEMNQFKSTGEQSLSEEKGSLSPVIFDESSSENEAEVVFDNKNLDFDVNSSKLFSKTSDLSGEVTVMIPGRKESLKSFDASCASFSTPKKCKMPEKVPSLSETVYSSESKTGLCELNNFQSTADFVCPSFQPETPHWDLSLTNIEHFQHVKGYLGTLNSIKTAEKELLVTKNLDFTVNALQSFSKKSQPNEKEVDLHSSDSSGSVEFLRSSCASLENICQTPKNVKSPTIKVWDIENNFPVKTSFCESSENQVAENSIFESRAENIPAVDDAKELIDVDSEDSIPVNSSQKSQLNDAKDLDLCNVKSDDSEDSVKFLKPCFESFNSLDKLPKKVVSPFNVVEITASSHPETLSCESNDFNISTNSTFWTSHSPASHSLVGFYSEREKNIPILNNANTPSNEKNARSEDVFGNEKEKTPGNKYGEDYLKFKLSDSPITPLPDYKSMVTPEIKQALKRIGVKALPRKKAVAILSHVYDETHPLMNSETNRIPQKIAKGKKETPTKKRKNVSNDSKKITKKHRGGNSLSTSQESNDSTPENPDWLGCIPEMSFSQFSVDSPTKINKDDLEAIRQYIQSNDELYNSVLSYMPLNLVEFHQELKKEGIKTSIQKLMDFLDEQCITFTCPRKEEYKKKQNARTQRFRKNMIAKLSQQPK